eukprot:gnl/MRDRNA2_/MRDRNA2_83744_c0_seq1.p1 gnl/MRDRNA2_/MRDRNA2_83744_c0~~gnl/MRDRNA2_/MRDRNA2_83744_c0_seq1.p1  ORF type:complete len:175 (+),score=37.04 gnl/MRDRNA2_/MRDRNA2_83744_c0_seq1:80-604(+)
MGTTWSNSGRALQVVKEVANTLNKDGLSMDDAFRMYDSDDNKVLDESEFCRMVMDLCPRATVLDAELLFAEVDVDRNGEVDYNEFCRKFGSHIQKNGAKLMSSSKRRLSHLELQRIKESRTKKPVPHELSTQWTWFVPACLCTSTCTLENKESGAISTTSYMDEDVTVNSVARA